MSSEQEQSERSICIICGLIFEGYENGDPRVCDFCWKCPKCGVSSSYLDPVVGREVEGLIIDTVYELENFEPYRIVCYRCEKEWDTAHFEKDLAKVYNVEPCSCFKGRGFVPNKKKKRGKKQ